MEIDSFMRDINRRISGQILTRPVTDFLSFAKRIDAVASSKTGNVNQISGEINAFTGQNYLEALASRADPIFSVDWLAYVVDPEGGQISIPWQMIDTFQAPTLSIEPSPVFRSGKIHNYAGTFNCSSISAGLYTDNTGAAMSFASGWLAATFSPQLGIYQLPASYKKTVKLFIHDSKHRVVCEYTFYGCFPTSWTGYGLENSGSVPLVTTLELSVDAVAVGSQNSEDFSAAVLSQANGIRQQAADAFSRSPLSRILDKSRVSGLFGK